MCSVKESKGCHRCFPMSITKFWNKPILKHISNGCFWKSKPQWQIYGREVIPECCSPFKANYPSILILTMTERFFSLKHDYFIIKTLFYSIMFTVHIVEIIVESVNLIQISKQNRELLSQWLRTMGFLIKKYISKHRAKRRMLL